MLFSFFHLGINGYNEYAALEQSLLREAANTECRDCVHFSINDICSVPFQGSATYLLNLVFLLAAFASLQTARLTGFLFAALFHSASLAAYGLWFFTTYSYYLHARGPEKLPKSVADHIFLDSTWVDFALFTFVLMIFVFQIYHLFNSAMEKARCVRQFS